MPPKYDLKKELKKNPAKAGITTVESLYKPEDAQIEEKVKDQYKTFKSTTHSLGKMFASYGKGQKFTPEQEEIFGFLDWDITAEEYFAASRGSFMLGIVVGAVLAAAVYFTFSEQFGLYNTMLGALVVFFIPLGLAFYYQKYPQMAAEKEKLLALAYVPEIVNYIIMSMRLNPNLEKAVEFAASHGRGKIAEELKKIIWLVQLGKYSSVEEALDDLAYRWGPYSEDFKQALMTIRASVLEADKLRREAFLEKAITDVLEGSKEKMDMYARGLHQPTVFLYYFGILLPLMLAIILPIGAAFMKDSQIARPEFVFALYCLLLPAGVYIYGKSILGGRPPTYIPPDIPENFPGTPRKGLMSIGGVQLPYKIIALFLFVLALSLGLFGDYLQESQTPSYMKDEIKNVPYIELPFGTYRIFAIFGFLIGTSLAMSIYLYGKYGARKKAQDEIREMEGEFKDAIYVLASRLGENRPMEEAMRQALDFLPRSKVANRVFRRILENVTMLGMTVDAAVFDGAYGAMKNLPSQTLRSGLQIMVDSVEIGVNVAAKSLISLSMQLRNSQKIDEMLKRLLSDITVLLSTMAVFVAPIVLAVVSSLQTVIINSLSNLGGVGGSGLEDVNTPGFNAGAISGLFSDTDLSKSSATPGQFLVIMGIYLIEIVALLVYFNAQIEDSNNKL
ncbi:MAG: hypothetical protein ABH863_04830, partial [Candidatus Micrarchaeota archaeon]